MKKLIYAALLALPLIGLASCSDDGKDLPDVDFSLEVSGATIADDQMYVVADSVFSIDALTVVNNQQGKAVIVPYANYYWDNYYIGRAVVAPLGITIQAPGVELVGAHTLGIACPVYAVDKEPAFANLEYTVNVVADVADLPSAGTTTTKAHPNISSEDTK